MPAKRDLKHVDAEAGAEAARAVLDEVAVGAAEPVAAWLRLVEVATRAGWKSPACRSFVETLAATAANER